MKNLEFSGASERAGGDAQWHPPFPWQRGLRTRDRGNLGKGELWATLQPIMVEEEEGQWGQQKGQSILHG